MKIKNSHSENYVLGSFLINSQGKLGLYHLLNLLQDSASSHAFELGIGKKAMEEMKMFWVLTRQKLSMSKWPKWHDHITIDTWIRSGEGPMTNRDFRIYSHDELIGEATTSWLALSSETRKPVPWDHLDVFKGLERKEGNSLNTEKIPPRKDAERLISFNVRNSDIDQNMHVNNTKYAQWILDAIPLDDHSRYLLNGYEVNFLLETKLNDQIRIERTLIEEGHVHFQGVRLPDEKVVFTSLLHFSY